MAKVQDDEVEGQASRGAHSDHGGPAFEAQLSGPWGSQYVRCRVPTRVSEVTRVVEDRSRVHEEWIRQDARTKRLALIVGAVLFLAGCQVIVFAPSGRETVAAIVGAAMLVVAAGTAGYRRVWARAPLISVGAGDPELAFQAELAAAVERTKRKQQGLIQLTRRGKPDV